MPDDTTLPVAQDARAIMTPVILDGDTSRLSADQKVDYLFAVCRTVGVNPMTQPFQFVKLQGREVLYATRTCTDELRARHGISLDVLSEEIRNGLIVVRVKATNAQGRSDSDLGAVPAVYPQTYRDRSGQFKPHPRAGKPLEGEDFSNALMKATTKAKRRVTLSLCGLGWLDETEVASVQQAELDLAQARDARPTPKAQPMLSVVLSDGEVKEFPKTRRSEGIPALLDLLALELAQHGPRLMLEPDNISLLDNIAKLPEFASRVADIRAAANKALVPDADLTDEALGIPDFDPETDDAAEPDPVSERAAVRRGAVPSDTQDPMPA